MSKQIIGVIVLLVLIIGAVIFTVTRTTTSKPIPKDVVTAKMKVYDLEDKKIVDVSAMDYKDKYKIVPDVTDKIPSGCMLNPANGHHYLVPLSCFSCSKIIPPALIYKGQDGIAAMKGYKCPECGGPAYSPQVIQNY
jgi:hypothetical protein